MCLIAGMFGATAAAAASAQAVTGLVISAVGTVAGMAQAQQQQAMAEQQAAIQSRNQQRQVQYERLQQQLKHIGDVKAQQSQTLSYQKQIFNNSEAANRVYVQEQLKLQEAKAKAAFKSQEIYAKQIGALGTVLSTGATGQSVGLLAMDAQRQAGFAGAQQNASLRSAADQAATTMESTRLENESSNNVALSKLAAPVQAPQFSPWVTGIGGGSDPGIPSYNWGL